MNYTNPVLEESDNILLRELEIEDYYKGYLVLLNYLTSCEIMSYENFVDTFSRIKENPNHKIFVLYDYERNIIVGTCTILLEQKFTHNSAVYAHIEDLVILSSYRYQHLGERLLKKVTNYAKDKNCYKIVLKCKSQVYDFFDNKNFVDEGFAMSKTLTK